MPLNRRCEFNCLNFRLNISFKVFIHPLHCSLSEIKICVVLLTYLELLAFMNWFYVMQKITFLSWFVFTTWALKLLAFMDWFNVCLKVMFLSWFVFTIWALKLMTFIFMHWLYMMLFKTHYIAQLLLMILYESTYIPKQVTHQNEFNSLSIKVNNTRQIK